LNTVDLTPKNKHGVARLSLTTALNTNSLEPIAVLSPKAKLIRLFDFE
jgi:hypothetical protein